MQTFDQTLTRLKQLITESAMGVGDRIPPERVLATELGVGRRSLRRALDILEQEGQISRRQGRGTFINGARESEVERSDAILLQQLRAAPLDQILEHTNPLEVVEIRLAIEPVMARLGALRAPQCDMRKLNRLSNRRAKGRNPASFKPRDEKFPPPAPEAS